MRFGAMSFVLAIGALQGGLVAGLLATRRPRRVADAVLAVLLAAFVLRLMPFILGYAGAYDVHPWLSFAPFAITLAYGPLVYLYVVAVTTGRLPARWYLHLAPAALQAAYYVVIFAQTQAFKNWFDARVNVPYVDPVEAVLTIVSLGGYVAAAARRYAGYRRELADARSDAAAHELAWLRTFLILFAVTVGLNAGFDAYSRFVRHLNYFQFFWLYVWYALLVYALALEGWRNAGRVPALPATGAPAPARSVPARAVREDAEAWLARVAADEHWRDQQLTLDVLAARMGMPASQISRLVNEGLGQNFNEAINRLRVADVRSRLADPTDERDLLDIAFAAGFSSKASFNRCFKAYVGTTPSAYRGAARS